MLFLHTSHKPFCKHNCSLNRSDVTPSILNLRKSVSLVRSFLFLLCSELQVLQTPHRLLIDDGHALPLDNSTLHLPQYLLILFSAKNGRRRVVALPNPSLRSNPKG